MHEHILCFIEVVRMECLKKIKTHTQSS